MQQALTLKPWHSSQREGVHAVEARLSPEEPRLYRFEFRALGDIRALRIPRPAEPERCDGLWQHTCFEVFLMQADGGYCEFNFSPSTQWAAYRFDGYRRAMTDLPLRSAPRIEVVVERELLVLDATVRLPPLAIMDGAPRNRVAIAAVIENLGGALEYWALAHPAGKPDFHHADGFIATLPDNGV